MPWFVLRDLKRPNALLPAYKELSQLGFNVFTPIHNVIKEIRGERKRREEPVVRDLLFVKSERSELDKIINSTKTLQYRFVKGAKAGTVMTVRDDEMNRFISATRLMKEPKYFTPAELSEIHIGQKVRIVCPGPLDGYEGNLISIRGSRKRRIIVSIPGLLATAIEISQSDYIQIQ